MTLKRTLLPRCGFDIFHCTDVTTLHFSKNRLGPQAFNVLMFALSKAPPALTYIDVSSNMATHECCAAIAEAISSTKTIKWLNLSDNPLTTSAAETIGGALKVNRSLRHLGLASVGIADASQLFEGLAGHTLESFDVSNNVSGPRSFAKLAQALTSGLLLKTLLARGVDMRNEGASALAGGIRASKSVRIARPACPVRPAGIRHRPDSPVVPPARRRRARAFACCRLLRHALECRRLSHGPPPLQASSIARPARPVGRLPAHRLASERPAGPGRSLTDVDVSNAKLGVQVRRLAARPRSPHTPLSSSMPRPPSFLLLATLLPPSKGSTRRLSNRPSPRPTASHLGPPTPPLPACTHAYARCAHARTHTHTSSSTTPARSSTTPALHTHTNPCSRTHLCTRARAHTHTHMHTHTPAHPRAHGRAWGSSSTP